MTTPEKKPGWIKVAGLGEFQEFLTGLNRKQRRELKHRLKAKKPHRFFGGDRR